MTEWILILTLVGNTNQSGQSIEHVPGFVSLNGCNDAGSAWLKQVYKAQANRTARALCVEKR